MSCIKTKDKPSTTEPEQVSDAGKRQNEPLTDPTAAVAISEQVILMDEQMERQSRKLKAQHH